MSTQRSNWARSTTRVIGALLAAAGIMLLCHVAWTTAAIAFAAPNDNGILTISFVLALAILGLALLGVGVGLLTKARGHKKDRSPS